MFKIIGWNIMPKETVLLQVPAVCVISLESQIQPPLISFSLSAVSLPALTF